MKISEGGNRIREKGTDAGISVSRALAGGGGISIQFKRGRGNIRKRAELSLARNRKEDFLSFSRREMKTNHAYMGK